MRILLDISVTARNGQPLDGAPRYVASVTPTALGWQVTIDDKTAPMRQVAGPFSCQRVVDAQSIVEERLQEMHPGKGLRYSEFRLPEREELAEHQAGIASRFRSTCGTCSGEQRLWRANGRLREGGEWIDPCPVCDGYGYCF